jgi:hypothetical protein
MVLICQHYSGRRDQEEDVDRPRGGEDLFHDRVEDRFTAGPEEIIAAMTNIQSQSTLNQIDRSKATIEALWGHRMKWIKWCTLAQRRDTIVVA